jgi:hypothetical protein
MVRVSYIRVAMEVEVGTVEALAPRETSQSRKRPLLRLPLGQVGGDAWELNPPRTPQQRPANGKTAGLASIYVH